MLAQQFRGIQQGGVCVLVVVVVDLAGVATDSNGNTAVMLCWYPVKPY